VNDLTHIDLFSGIGGFSLAAGWAGFRTIAFCEIEPFCQEVLKARFGAVAESEGERQQSTLAEQDKQGRSRDDGLGQVPTARDSRPILIPDIFAFDGTRFRGATLLTGGFPCQPFSHAGKRRGKEDDRAIWPQMLRVIHEARPAWVIGENVSGLISMELDSVLADLELEGYATRTFHIGAVGVNAPHRRMRVWIVAQNTLDDRGGVGESQEQGHLRDERDAIAGDGERVYRKQNPDTPQDPLLGGDGGRGDGDTPRLRRALQTPRPDSDAPDAARDVLDGQGREERGGGRGLGDDDSVRKIRQELPSRDAPDADESGQPHRAGEYRGSSTSCGTGERCDGRPSSIQAGWDIPWIEVATSLCRVDDGLPAWIHARRVSRLKALGNAIVPQVAYEIIKGIAEIERAT